MISEQIYSDFRSIFDCFRVADRIFHDTESKGYAQMWKLVVSDFDPLTDLMIFEAAGFSKSTWLRKRDITVLGRSEM